ncbi:MAG: thiamine phosphate synthase [Blastocatellia bacterium]|nr:thiamine phosphate synthase [Blastocatellia bacterium]
MPEFRLPKVYPLTDTRISGLTHREQARALIDGGCRFLQIRDKSMSSGSFFEAALETLAVVRAAGGRLIVNDRVDVAIMIGADGVHLGQDDLPPTEARILLGPKSVIGFSTHTVEQAIEASRLPLDYIAFGPIFPTGSKPDHDPVVGVDAIAKVRDAIGDIPLVAIGGIDASNISAVLDAGADSAAVIGAVLGEPGKIAARFTELASAAEVRLASLI